MRNNLLFIAEKEQTRNAFHKNLHQAYNLFVAHMPLNYLDALIKNLIINRLKVSRHDGATCLVHNNIPDPKNGDDLIKKIVIRYCKILSKVRNDRF